MSRTPMGEIVAMGEVVADLYHSEGSSPLEIPFTARPGGSPANVAVGVARLGARAGFIGAVGEDLFGEFILSALSSENVETEGVRRLPDPARTSIAFVEIDASGERSFTFYRSSPAADELLSPQDVSEGMFSGASFLTFGSIPLIGDRTREAVLKAAWTAKDSGVAVAFDVNLRQHLWESVEEARERVWQVFEFARVVKLGEDELMPLFRSGDTEEVVGRLFQEGVSLVFVTRGKGGALYFGPGFSGEIPAFEVEAADSTGAGDAFVAAALSHLSGEEWEEGRVREAAERGCAAGAVVCRRQGAMSVMPTGRDLEEFIGSSRRG